MTKRTARLIGYGLWVLGLVPAALIAMWLGLAPFTWGGFSTALVILAAISLVYGLLERWVRRMLERRAERRAATPPSP
jgi:hypothetical protein